MTTQAARRAVITLCSLGLGLTGMAGARPDIQDKQVVAAVESPYATAVLSDHPVLYYRLGETPADIAAPDESGNNHDGQYVGDVTRGLPGAIHGDPDTAVQLDGSTGYITTSSIEAVQGDHARSVEMWFKTLTSSNQQLFDSGAVGPLQPNGQPSPTGQAFQIGLAQQDGIDPISHSPATTPGVYVAFWDDDVYLPNLTLADGRWHHFVVTLSGTQLTIFVDARQPRGYVWRGPVNASTAGWSPLTAQPFLLPYTPQTAANAILIGRSREAIWRIGSAMFAGLLDEVAIYDYALTADQVVTHYQIGERGTSLSPNQQRVAAAVREYRQVTDLAMAALRDEATSLGQEGDYFREQLAHEQAGAIVDFVTEVLALLPWEKALSPLYAQLSTKAGTVRTLIPGARALAALKQFVDARTAYAGKTGQEALDLAARRFGTALVKNLSSRTSPIGVNGVGEATLRAAALYFAKQIADIPRANLVNHAAEQLLARYLQDTTMRQQAQKLVADNQALQNNIDGLLDTLATHPPALSDAQTARVVADLTARERALYRTTVDLERGGDAALHVLYLQRHGFHFLPSIVSAYCTVSAPIVGLVLGGPAGGAVGTAIVGLYEQVGHVRAASADQQVATLYQTALLQSPAYPSEVMMEAWATLLEVYGMVQPNSGVLTPLPQVRLARLSSVRDTHGLSTLTVSVANDGPTDATVQVLATYSYPFIIAGTHGPSFQQVSLAAVQKDSHGMAATVASINAHSTAPLEINLRDPAQGTDLAPPVNTPLHVALIATSDNGGDVLSASADGPWSPGTTQITSAAPSRPSVAKPSYNQLYLTVTGLQSQPTSPRGCRVSPSGCTWLRSSIRETTLTRRRFIVPLTAEAATRGPGRMRLAAWLGHPTGLRGGDTS